MSEGNKILCVSQTDFMRFGCTSCGQRQRNWKPMIQGDTESWYQCHKCTTQFAVAHAEHQGIGLTVSAHPRQAQFTTQSGLAVVVEADDDDPPDAETLDPEGSFVTFLPIANSA